MRIQGRGVKSLAKFLPVVGNGEPFRVGVPVQGREDRLREIGFSDELEAGLSILPAVEGKISEFNARGREAIHKDKPKEPQARMVFATWNDWHGYPHSGIQIRNYMVYPREHIDGPEERVMLLNSVNGLVAASAEMTVGEFEGARALHVVNLFLEYFGECELFGKDISPIAKVKRVNWKIFPPGEYPWDKVKGKIQEATRKLSDSERPVIEYRISRITKYSPDLVAIGNGGFDEYFVFGFQSKNLFVLESAHLDNATYILKSDWQELSQLTKREILKGGLHQHRLIHSGTWGGKLHGILGK